MGRDAGRLAGSQVACDRPPSALCLDYLRSGLKPARTSSEKSCGCSQAAKCPPLSRLVEVDQFGIRPLCPTARGRIELVRKDAHGNRDGGATPLTAKNDVPLFSQ